MHCLVSFYLDSTSEQFPSTHPFHHPPQVPGIPSNPIYSAPESSPTPLDPRDEVLKPEFRSHSSREWNGKDVVLDDRYFIILSLLIKF